MDKEHDYLVKRIALVELEIKLKEAQLEEGLIVPDSVFEVIRNLKEEYKLTN